MVALIVFRIPAAMKQHRHSPILKHAQEHVRIDWMRIGIVILILMLALATNVTVNTKFPSRSSNFPFIGVAVWVAILISIGMRRPDRGSAASSAKEFEFFALAEWVVEPVTSEAKKASWKLA